MNYDFIVTLNITTLQLSPVRCTNFSNRQVAESAKQPGEGGQPVPQMH